MYRPQIYVMVGKVPAELLGINSNGARGKYHVLLKGELSSRWLEEIGMKVGKSVYDEYKVEPTKPASKRSKKNV